MADPRSLARHLRVCWDQDRIPKIEAADAKLWFLALDELIRRGALAEAAYAATHLTAAFPGSLFIERLAMLLARVPPAVADPVFAAFTIREDAEIQIVPRTWATTVLFAFCGRHGSLGVPVPLAHRWFGELGVHVVYLRDLSGALYYDGLPSLAGGRVGTIRALRSVVDGLKAERLICYGNSNGGFAALLYGLEMSAAAVLATNVVTIFPPDRVLPLAGRYAPGHHPGDLSIAELYAAATARPRAHLVYGAGNADDAASAATFSGIPGVTTEAVPGCDRHDAQAFLIKRGLFGPLLKDFVAGWPAGGPDA